MSRRPIWPLFLGLAALVVVLDQLTKAWLTSFLAPGQMQSIVGDYVRLVLGQNNGALFGLFRDSALLFGIVSLVVIALIVGYHARGGRSVLPVDHAGAAARRRDRQHHRPAPARLRRRLRRSSGSGRSAGTRSTSPTRRSASRWSCSCSSRSGRRSRARRRPTRARTRRSCRRRSRPSRRPGPMPDATALLAGGSRDLRVPDGAAAQRVDRFVADVTGLSRSHVQKLISAGNLTSGGIAAQGQPVVIGRDARSTSSCRSRRRSTSRPRRRSRLDVVYEDDDLLIVDKPAGLVVHPSPGHSDDTLVNALLARGGPETFGGIAGVQRPGIVHRLDRDTSGLLMVARTDAAQHSLMAQLKARRVKKTYLALVARRGRRGGRPDRGADRPRPEAPDADGASSPTAGRPRPATGSASGSRAGRSSSSTSSPAGRTRSASISRRSATRSRATRSTGRGRRGRGPDVRGPAGEPLRRLFLHAWRLELTSPIERLAHPGGGAAPRGAGAGPRRAPRPARLGGPPVTDQIVDISADPGRPASVVDGAPGAMLIIISGPSGVGKDTIIDALRRREAETGRDGDRHYVVTCTTRAPRDGEVDGVDYHFMTRDEFLAKPRRPRLPRGERGPRQLVRLAARPGPRRARRRPRRDPEDRRPGRPGRQGAGHRGAPDLHRPAVARDAVRAAAGAGDRDRRRARASASATPRSSSPGRRTTTTSSRTRPARSSGPPTRSRRSSPPSIPATRPVGSASDADARHGPARATQPGG